MAITGKEHATGRHYKSPEVKIIVDRAVRFKNIKVHDFLMSDVEDPDLFAAKPLSEWADSEVGKWCIENAEEVPYWIRQTDHTTYGYRYAVMARLSEQNETYFRLRFQK